MSLFSDLVAKGRIRDRDQLRRVYRRLVKRLHPDSSGGVSAPPRSFVDFDSLKRELGEAELLLEELADDSPGASAPERPAPSPPAPATPPGPRPATRTPGPAGDSGAAPLFDRDLLIGELRDLVARGFPVNARAASRNRAYRECVATVSSQLSLLTGDPLRFEKVDAQMGVAKYGSLRLHYYVMQVLWNGLDWGLSGYAASRDTALRDFGVIRETLVDLGMAELEALLSWIIAAGEPFSREARTGASRR